MKLKFTDQPYQTDAVNSISDIFEVSEIKDSFLQSKLVKNIMQ